MADQVFDLFGDPWVDRPRKRGRPRHEVSAKNRKRVSMLVALGWTNPRIAATLSITLPTLHRYYFYEIAQREAARDKLEARRLELAWEMLEAGNVAAFREFGKLLDRNDRMTIEESMGKGSDAAPVSSGKPGKKMIDEERAHAADADLMAELESEAAAQNAKH